MINRENNFDFLRLLFSSLVIFSHSYPLTQTPEVLGTISNDQINFGRFAVDSFFIISGFLILNSLQRSKSIFNYLLKRVLRLFPALIVLFIITLLVIPFFYKGENIFQERTYWLYLPKNITLYGSQSFVNGVFENNPYERTINGSLWTLRYEFTMYLLVALFFYIRKQKILLASLFFAMFITAYLFYINQPDYFDWFFNLTKLRPKELYRLSTYFLGGCLMVFIDFKKFNKLKITAILSLIICLSVLFDCYKLVSPLCLPFIVISIGLSSTKYINNTSHTMGGDLSYGVYIYAFLVQQSLMNYFTLTPFTLFAISLPITYFLAFLSWKFVEEKALRFKNENHLKLRLVSLKKSNLL